ncbi:hypothetical protein [Streptomyces zingiberis]|uniref:Secreted protein n=1 Tax=Streptomyces zingiberis TaxID=2053010 RepID=A0ABX1BWT2_9ACTN|nr:hypothetical protein [Streptomyces zingiberis]NJQ01553.1 hypothetical protein [Streptomyces zingiberis]
MPLLSSPAPGPARASALAALGSPAAARAVTPALRVHPGPLAPESPLPVHVMEGINEPDGPRVRLTGWRFLIRGGGRTVAAVETAHTPDGWVSSRFFGGPYLSSTEHALRQADALPVPHQPRLLSVPELYMLTLWLHGDTTADPATGRPDPEDLLIPLAPAPPGIAAHRPHRVSDLLPVLTLRLGPVVPLAGSAA